MAPAPIMAVRMVVDSIPACGYIVVVSAAKLNGRIILDDGENFYDDQRRSWQWRGGQRGSW